MEASRAPMLSTSNPWVTLRVETSKDPALRFATKSSENAPILSIVSLVVRFCMVYWGFRGVNGVSEVNADVSEGLTLEDSVSTPDGSWRLKVPSAPEGEKRSSESTG